MKFCHRWEWKLTQDSEQCYKSVKENLSYIKLYQNVIFYYFDLLKLTQNNLGVVKLAFNIKHSIEKTFD